MSVFELCERAVSLVRGNRLQLSSSEKTLLEALNYEGLTSIHAQDEACVCALHFAGVRDRLQQLYPWRFARRTLALSDNSLPAEALNVLGLYKDNKPLDYTITGDSIRIYSDTQSTSDITGALLTYTAKQADTSKWPAIFCDVFCYSLAVEICAAVTGEPQYTQLLEQKAQELIQRAYQIGEIQPETRLTLRQEIYNRAIGLSRGQRSINAASSEAVTQGVDNAGVANARTRSEMQACLRAADSVRDRLLQLYPWVFARKRGVLSGKAITDENMPQYGYFVDLPNNFLKALAVLSKGVPIDYEIMSDYGGTNSLLFCNSQTPTMFYTSRITDMEKWDGAFIDVYVYELAQEIVAATTNNLDTIQVLSAKAQQLIKDAIKIGAIKAEIVFSATDEIYQRAIAIAHGQRTLSTVSDAAETQGLDVTGDINARNREELEVCKRSAGNVRDRLLQLYAWRFARKSTVLSVTAATADGWTKAYKLPDDCLRVLAVLSNGEYVEYEEAGGIIYSNVLTPTVRYTARITNVSNWDNVFTDIYVYELAQEIISATTNSLETMQVLKQRVQELVKDAVKIGVIRAELSLSASEELYNRAIALAHGQRMLGTTSEAAESQGVDFTGDVNFRNREELIVCKRSANYVRDRLLQLYAWTFARKSTVLNTTASKVSGWTNAYSLPNDCLRVLALLSGGEYTDYEEAGSAVYCNALTPTIRYTARIEDISQWDNAFADVFVCELAQEIVSATTNNLETMQALRQRAQELVKEAVRIGAIKSDIRLSASEELYNRAIALVHGQRTLNTTSEVSETQGIDFTGDINFRNREELAVCRRSANYVRDRLLQLYAWIFARKSTVLNVTASTVSGWANAYKLPNDCLRVLAVLSDDDYAEYEEAGGVVYCNFLTPTVRYTSKIEDTSKWDNTFTDVFVYELAQEIISATTNSLETMQLLKQRTQELVKDAMRIGAIKADMKLSASEELYNRAIALFHGQRTLGSTSEVSETQGADFTGDINFRNREELAVCRRSSGYVRDRLLELHAWDFAKKTVIATKTTAIAGWSNGYNLPSDCLKVLNVLVNDEPVDYEVSDGKILCNGADAYVRYIARVENISSWTPAFKDAFCCELAMEIASAVGMNAEALQLLSQKSQSIINQAYRMGSIKPEMRITLKDEVCNRAIALAQGTRTVSGASDNAVAQGIDIAGNLNDRYLEAVKVAKRSYEPLRDRLLQAYSWQFARKTATVTNGGALPSDCLVVLSVLADDEPCDWEIAGGHISVPSTASISYTAKITDGTKWDATFKEALCYSLAVEIVSATTASAQTIQYLEQKIQELVTRAYQLGVIKNETRITQKQEIFTRAINLVHGQRTVAPSSEVSVVQGLDTTGQVNDRAEAETRACLAAWESVRDKLLQLHAWTFARKSKVLEAVVNAPKGWRYGYELPADCLTVLTVITDRTDERETSSLQGTKPVPVEWEVSGGNLYCDFEPVTIRYTGKVTGLTGCPAPFIDAMAYLLACEVMNAVAPTNEGTAAAIKTFQTNANEAIQQAVSMGVIRPETIIPVRHGICARAMGLVKGLRDADHIDYLYNREQEELTTCLRNFNFVRDRLLQMYPWVFARKTTKLLAQAETLSGWRYGYTLPGDCLNVVSVATEIDSAQGGGSGGGRWGGGMCCCVGNADPINLVELSEYETTGSEIYTNRSPIYLRYTSRVIDTHKWAPVFTDVFCVMLAIEIALSVVDDKRIVEVLKKQIEFMIQAAMENKVIDADTGLIKQSETMAGYGRAVPWLDYSGIPTLACSPNEYCGGWYCENNADEFFSG